MRKNRAGIITFVGNYHEAMKIGILKETKIPPDRRVPLSPTQAATIVNENQMEIVVQPSPIRCFTDDDYRQRSVPLSDDLASCDVLFGVKEVAIPTLIPQKTYVFFSHTAKKQPYNRELLQEIVKKKITLIDYEYITDPKGNRLVAFGRWAGIVGAYKGLRALGIRSRTYAMKPAGQCHDLKEMLQEVGKVRPLLSPVKILITGGGRVAHGAMETLAPLKLLKVTAGDYLTRDFDRPVLCQIDPDDYVRRKGGGSFSLNHFFRNPKEYESTFLRYALETDLYIPCHYWHPDSPVFLKPGDYLHPDFRIRVIADVSCDIRQPIASTLRPSTIEAPFYGYNPLTGEEGDPFDERNITVMAVDNLPGELPRDASEDFGRMLMQHILPAFLDADAAKILSRATIVRQGELTQQFAYLRDYLEGKE